MINEKKMSSAVAVIGVFRVNAGRLCNFFNAAWVVNFSSYGFNYVASFK